MSEFFEKLSPLSKYLIAKAIKEKIMEENEDGRKKDKGILR